MDDKKNFDKGITYNTDTPEQADGEPINSAVHREQMRTNGTNEKINTGASPDQGENPGTGQNSNNGVEPNSETENANNDLNNFHNPGND